MNARITNLDAEFKPLGSGAEELAVADSVVTAAALPANATHAMLGVKTGAVNVAFGRDPAQGGAGITLAAGAVVYMNEAELAAARFIRATTTSGVVSIEPGTF